MSDFISVKNFERFQHYKDRKPTWIKLYNELLDDYAFGCLPDASKWLAIGLWLLASRHDNRVPNDPEWIARMIHSSGPVDIQPLLTAGFVYAYTDASELLAEPEHIASLEEELETDTSSSSLDMGARDVESRASEIIRLANRGMAHNPAIGDACNPIPTGHGSRQTVLDWLSEGIPPDLAGAVVLERAKEYQPDGRRRQITTMRYFDGAVRDAHDQAQAEATGPPGKVLALRIGPRGDRAPSDTQTYKRKPYQGLNG